MGNTIIKRMISILTLSLLCGFCCNSATMLEMNAAESTFYFDGTNAEE